MVGLVERCFPHARAELEDAIEEERRLAYVALTRARERLVLTWPQRRRAMDGSYEPALMSRFLREIPTECFSGAAPPRAPSRSVASTLSPPRPPSPPQRPAFGASRTGDGFRGALPRPATSPRPSADESGEWEPRRTLPSAPQPRPTTVARPPDRRTLVPESMNGFQPGVEVFHPTLGDGTITKREGIPANPRLTIHFRTCGPRIVFAASAGLEILL